MAQDLSLSIKVRGDANELSTALDRAENDLQALKKTATDIKVLEGAEASVRRFEGELQAAQSKVSALQTALSEAYAADADAPLLRRLNAELTTAEKEAGKAADALTKSQTAIVKLNLEAGRTGVSTSNLAEASRLLAVETAKVAANVDTLKAKMAAAASAEEMLTARTRSVASAFDRLNIRSAETIKADIAEINQALIKLGSNAGVAGADFDRAFAAGQAQIAKLNAELSSLPVEPATKGIGGLSGAFSSLQGVLGGLGVAAVGQKFLDANLAADKLQKSLNAVNGDAKKTESDLAFLRETAQHLGINLESSAAAFVKLAAAAKGTSLEGQATRDIFTGLGSAMSQLGLSSAETDRAFISIAQMMSKGTVMAEELKGQLGDVLPGALSIAARATGLTTQELAKLMETGGLLAEDFLPKFAAEAKKSFGGAAGEAQGLSNTIERVKNSWSQAFKIFGDTGVLASLAAILGIVNEAFLLLATGVTTVTSGFFAFVKSIGVVAAAIRTLSFSTLKDGLADIGNELLNNVTRMAGLTGTSKLVGDALNSAGESAHKAAATAAQAGVGWEKLVVAYDQAVKSAADYVEMAKKVATANNDQAGVLVKIAQLSGNENNLLIAKEDAARKAAAGSDSLAQALDREAKTLQAKLIALQEEIKGQKNVSDEKIKAIEEAKKLAEAKAEEARAALSGADAARVAAAAAEAESAARYDNSLRVKELKTAYEEAAVKVDLLRAAQASGVNVTVELTAAQVASAKAAALYNDALRDQVDRIGQSLAAKQSQVNIEQVGIRLAIEQQRTILEVARARGDEYGATQALLEIKRLEIKLAELTAQAKRAEAEAALLTAQAKREELIASGQLTAAKEADLKAQEAGAKVKQVEAQIAGETASRMRQLADAYGQAGNSAAAAAGHIEGIGGAARASIPGVEALTSRLNDLNAAERAAAGHADPMNNKGYGSDGGHQADKNFNWTDIMYQRGASLEEAKAASKYVGELYARNQATMLTGNLGDSENAARLNKRAINDAVDKAMAAARKELATGQEVDLGAKVGDIIARNQATMNRGTQLTPESGIDANIAAIKRAGQEANNQKTIRLELGSGGSKSTLFANSEGDADAFIRTLEAAGMRASR